MAMTLAEMTADLFNTRYNKISKEIPFDPEWNNGTGYYDGAVDLELAPGEEAKSVSPMPNNRKLIFIGTQLGTVVLFQRFTDGADGVIVKNVSSDMRRLGMIPDGQLGYDALNAVLGYGPEDNVGARLKRAFEVMKSK